MVNQFNLERRLEQQRINGHWTRISTTVEFLAGSRRRGGATGKAFGLAISRSRVQILLEATLRNNLRQVVYTYVLCASVTKQYNLVPAKGR